ncbi:MAG TPA: maleylpyruvate isomerase family mycothiol-dependent enzyme [Acidimicrobiales bacterium]|nr:maleylpyruvate isomerase family mycothiol-dependent enzyme [Acidimicrobiales bacterium]
MAPSKGAPPLSRLYGETQARLVALVQGLDERDLVTPVPACPGWSVRDVVAHLTAVAEDVLEGRLTGPPSAEQTAAQVARFEDRSPAEVLARWDDLAPQFADMIDAFEVWPAVLDVAAHEQDIRGAVGEPGARDAEVVRLGADRLLIWLQPPVALRVLVEDDTYDVGPQGEAALVLRTDRFEAFRWRLGRRSRVQLANLDWTGDAAPVLDHLVVFGPAPSDIDE